MAVHRFGGEWTEEKLARLKKYLQAYTIIFDGNEKARYFTTSYVDAFAVPSVAATSAGLAGYGWNGSWSILCGSSLVRRGR